MVDAERVARAGGDHGAGGGGQTPEAGLRSLDILEILVQSVERSVGLTQRYLSGGCRKVHIDFMTGREEKRPILLTQVGTSKLEMR